MYVCNNQILSKLIYAKLVAWNGSLLYPDIPQEVYQKDVGLVAIALNGYVFNVDPEFDPETYPKDYKDRV